MGRPRAFPPQRKPSSEEGKSSLSASFSSNSLFLCSAQASAAPSPTLSDFAPHFPIQRMQEAIRMRDEPLQVTAELFPMMDEPLQMPEKPLQMMEKPFQMTEKPFQLMEKALQMTNK